MTTAGKVYKRRVTNRAAKVGMKHIEAKKPSVDWKTCGDGSRFTKANFMYVLGGISETAFDARRRSPRARLRIPACDGYDGRRPYWLAATVRAYFASGGAGVLEQMSR